MARKSIAGTSPTSPTRKARPFVPKREQGATVEKGSTGKTKPTKPKRKAK